MNIPDPSPASNDYIPTIQNLGAVGSQIGVGQIWSMFVVTPGDSPVTWTLPATSYYSIGNPNGPEVGSYIILPIVNLGSGGAAIFTAGTGGSGSKSIPASSPVGTPGYVVIYFTAGGANSAYTVT